MSPLDDEVVRRRCCRRATRDFDRRTINRLDPEFKRDGGGERRGAALLAAVLIHNGRERNIGLGRESGLRRRPRPRLRGVDRIENDVPGVDIDTAGDFSACCAKAAMRQGTPRPGAGAP